MDLDKAMVGVAKILFGLPNVSALVEKLQSGRQRPQDVLLKQKSIAKEICSNEPGCTVNYEAMYEKISIMEPYLKATLSGPGLIEFFANLRKLRHAWMADFAKYAAHAIITRLPEGRGAGGRLGLNEHAEATSAKQVPTLAHNLAAKEGQLRRFKDSHTFARYVYILEECIKKHKVHLLRKAHAEKSRVPSVKKQKAELRKRKKAVTVASRKGLQDTFAGATFNPDLPDFAQFMQEYGSKSPTKSAKQIPHHNGLQTYIMSDRRGAGSTGVVCEEGPPNEALQSAAVMEADNVDSTNVASAKEQHDRYTSPVDFGSSGIDHNQVQAEDSPHANTVYHTDLAYVEETVYRDIPGTATRPRGMNCESDQMFQSDEIYDYHTYFPDLMGFGGDSAVRDCSAEPQPDLDAMLGLNPDGSVMRNEITVIDPQLVSRDPLVFNGNNDDDCSGQVRNTLPVWLDKEEEACFRQIFGQD